MKRIKYISFGKVKPNYNKNREHSELLQIESKKVSLMNDENLDEAEKDEQLQEVEYNKVRVISRKQHERLQHDFEIYSKLTESKGTAAAVFMMKQNIIGSKVSGQEPTSIIDPVSGDLLHDHEEIKKASLNYCKQLLTNKEPKEGFEIDVEIKNMLHQKRMEESVDKKCPELSLHMFNSAWKSSN